ncbi:MAG TPA: hypothetical protein VHN98_09645 [Acidimicrobiales bacterium]|nr:hypothetical protein [Acidimicrobiales bacterium]
MTIRALRRLSVLTGAALLAALTFASPAVADYSPGQLSGSVSAPTDQQTLTTATVGVKGEFGYATQFGQPTGTVTGIDVSIVANAGQTVPDTATAHFDGAGDAVQAFAWTTPALPYNGPYTAHVVATGRAGLQNQSTTVDRVFSLAVPPVAPSDVTAGYDAGTGKITVLWSKNPEPDVVAYGVQRAPSGGSYSPLATVDAPTTKYVDTPGPGDWRYTVVAIRRGTTSDAVVASPDSSEAKVTMPAPTTTTQATGATASNGSGGAASSGGSTTSRTSSSSTSGSSSAAAPTASVDLKSFSALLDARRSTATTVAPKRVEPPDPGYQETLPFSKPKASASKDQPQLGAPDQPAFTAFASRILDDGRRRAGLTGVAGFLVLFVMMMQLRWVLAQVKADDLEALPATETAPDVALAAVVDDAVLDDAGVEDAGVEDAGVRDATADDFGPDVPLRDLADLLDDVPAAAEAGPPSLLPVVHAYAPVDAPALDVPQPVPARRRSRRRLADASNTSG